MVNINDALNRIKSHCGYKSDAALARALKATPQNVANWRVRNTVPWEELFAFSTKMKVPLDWILTGEIHGNDDSMAGWDAEVQEACLSLKRIYEGNPILKTALADDLKVFDMVTEMEKENASVKKMMEELLEQVKTTRSRFKATETAPKPKSHKL